MLRSDCNRERPINTDSPRKKVLRFSGRTAKFQAPKTPGTSSTLLDHCLKSLHYEPTNCVKKKYTTCVKLYTICVKLYTSCVIFLHNCW